MIYTKITNFDTELTNSNTMQKLGPNITRNRVGFIDGRSEMMTLEYNKRSRKHRKSIFQEITLNHYTFIAIISIYSQIFKNTKLYFSIVC